MKQDLPFHLHSGSDPEPGCEQPIKPLIEYPTAWTFTLFGTSEASVRDALAQALDQREHTFALSRASRKGKYMSFQIVLTIQDKEDHLALGNNLSAQPGIIFLL